MTTSRDGFRRLLLEYRAILICTRSLKAGDLARLNQDLSSLETLPRGTLRKVAGELQRKVDKLKQDFGVQHVADLLEPAAVWAESTPDDEYWVLKALLARCFKRYDRILPGFHQLPPHARVNIDAHGTNQLPSVPYLVLEAGLFEDMAALWNSLASAPLGEHRRDIYPYPPEDALRRALSRATARAAFSLLEGYLNCLAFDILLTREDLTPGEVELLTEWNAPKGAVRNKGLQEKVREYPKIAVRAAAPPVNAHNTPSLAFLLEAQVKARHAVTHPTPHVIHHNEPHAREFTFHLFWHSDAAAICDATVDLITAIDTAIGSCFGGVERWLKRREKTGLFPESSFY